jgi:hypothetical protein
MEKAEREAILRQGVVLPETPRQKREQAALEEDLGSIPLVGRPLRIRARNFGQSAEAYLASAGGPLPYMLRLREIEQKTADHEAALVEAWHALADECAEDPTRFARSWRSVARHWSFDEVNDLIDRHNRWYPVESRLPMDPRTGDYTLVNGRDYRRSELDAGWILERFTPSLKAAHRASP